MNYFIFIKDGIRYDSRDYGIGCGGFPDIVVPRERVTVESISGRSGSLITTDNCYDSYTKNIECFMEDDVYKDLSWLKGRGKLILSNELEREYDVYLKNNIELTQIATYYRNFILKFEVQPFKKGIEKHTLIYQEKNFKFTIGGNANALPIIYLTGNGDIDLTVNGNTCKLKNINTTIMLDSELMIAIENKENASPKTNGDFPFLKPGLNEFIIIGDLVDIKIQYQDTYL